jgi:ADP-heptose:LPS heptosyltransferase
MLDLPVPEDITPRFFWNRDKPQLPEELLQEAFIAIAPWSTAKTFDFYQDSGNKNWPLERWPAVIEWAHRRSFSVVQLRGSEEEPLLEGIDLDYCGRPLREALACIERASMLVSVDTMAHHAAAAFQVPSVVLWGRSKAAHFGYRQSHIINIQGECPGAPAPGPTDLSGHHNDENHRMLRDRPCIHGDQWAMDQEVCPIPGHPCMAGITVERVLEAMEQLMARCSVRKSVSVAA